MEAPLKNVQEQENVTFPLVFFAVFHSLLTLFSITSSSFIRVSKHLIEEFAPETVHLIFSVLVKLTCDVAAYLEIHT